MNPPSNDAEVYLSLGQSYLRKEQQDVKAAIEAFRRVNELEPDWAEGYHWLGIAQEECGNLEEALASFEQAVRLSPSDSRPRISLGVCQTRIGDFNAAIQQFREAISLKPRYGEASAHLFLADALLQAGEIDAAVAEWKLILDMPSAYPEYDSLKEEARKKLERYASAR